MPTIFNSLESKTKYYYAGEQQIAARTNSKLHYVLSDPSGQAVVFTDDQGQELGHVLFDPLGQVKSETDPELTTSLLPHLDPATGLQYNQGRWYDPTTGLHLQPIPAGAPRSFPQPTTPYAATPLGQPDLRLLDNGTSFLGLVKGGVIGEFLSLGVEQANEVLGDPLGVELLEQALKKNIGGAGFVEQAIPKIGKNFITGGIAEIAFAIPGFIELNSDPRLSGGQRFVQNVVQIGQVGASIGFGAVVGGYLGAFGGPVVFIGGVATGIVVDIAFEIGVKPIVSRGVIYLAKQPDPYRIIRRPKNKRKR